MEKSQIPENPGMLDPANPWEAGIPKSINSAGIPSFRKTLVFGLEDFGNLVFGLEDFLGMHLMLGISTPGIPG